MPDFIEILVRNKLLNEQQVVEAKKLSRSSNIHVRDALVKLGHVTPELACKATAKAQGLEYIKLDGLEIDPQVISLVPESIAREHAILPIAESEGALKVVMAESFLICLMGVGAGFLLSVIGRSALLHFFPTLTVDLIPRWFLLSAIMGIGGGLVGALYPAYRAAKLDPVEALNFE